VSRDALHDFFARFDELRGAVTELTAVRQALAAASTAAAAEPFADSAVHGHLRTPEVAVLGGSGADPFRERRVASRHVPGYADPGTLAQELRHGAAVLVERPELRSDALRQGLAGLDAALDAGRLACYQLYLEPRSQTLRFDCDRLSLLVTQLVGETVWDEGAGSDGGAAAETDGLLLAGRSRHLPAGTARGTTSCRPLSPTVLLVLAHREPGRRHLHEVLAECFLARLRESGAAERHHLVAAEEKADWLRDQLVAELTGPDPGAWCEGIDLLPEARPPAPAVAHSAAAVQAPAVVQKAAPGRKARTTA
jgi:hypothetical protein